MCGEAGRTHLAPCGMKSLLIIKPSSLGSEQSRGRRGGNGGVEAGVGRSEEWVLGTRSVPRYPDRKAADPLGLGRGLEGPRVIAARAWVSPTRGETPGVRVGRECKRRQPGGGGKWGEGRPAGSSPGS